MTDYNKTFADAAKKNDLLDCFSDEEKKIIYNCGSLKEYHRGDILQKEDHPISKFWIIQGGKIHKKRENNYIVLHADDITGIYHFLNDDNAYATLEVQSETVKVIEFDREPFIKMLQDNHNINIAFINFLSRQVRTKCNIIKNVIDGSVEKIRVAFFDSKQYMKGVFEQFNKEKNYNFKFLWFKDKLNANTATLANNCQVVCCFVNDHIDEETADILSNNGTGLVAMRCAGYDNVDLDVCKNMGLCITRVPAYSPYAVAEFAVTLMLNLNRKVHQSVSRVRQFNFSLNGLVGFDMRGKTVGVIGTGKIGRCVVDILIGFGCNVICYDVYKSDEIKNNPKTKYVELDELYAQSDIITIHVPLLKSTKYMFNKESFSKMKKGVMIINTSRGGLIKTDELIDALRSGQVGSVGLDVYEGEKKYFFEDVSNQYIEDITLTQLLAQPNVIVTSHQAFLTIDALESIAESTLESIKEYSEGKRGKDLTNCVEQEYS